MLIILATVTMPVYESARADAERAAKLADAREVANAIAGTLNTVYAGSIGSWQTVEYRLPEGVSSISFESGAENRISIRIVLNLKGENTVQVSTLLPSKGVRIASSSAAKTLSAMGRKMRLRL